MLERVFHKIQEWRYGNLGMALAAGAAIFTLTSTILQVAGVSGSPMIFLLTLYISSVLFFSVLFSLVNYQFQRELQLRRKIHQTSHVLMGRRSRIIGVVAPISYWSTEYYVDIIKAIRDAAEREQQHIRRKIIILDVPHEEFNDVEEIMTDILIKDISGLISINMKMSQPVKQSFCDAGIPIINIAHEDNKLPSVCSIVHDPTGLEDVFKHILLEKKSVSAILITKGLANPFKGVKVDAYRKGKRDLFTHIAVKAGLTVQPIVKLDAIDEKLDICPGNAYIVEVDHYRSQDGFLLFEKLPDFVPPNTAFIFLADITAVGFLLACQRSGLSALERKFRVAGVDNTEIAEWLDLTSVEAQLDIIGRLAYEKLQLALDHPDQISYSSEVVKGLCIIRGSSNW
ncbi:hypothetical protein KSF_011870 [Reticulibacter mediterranei]|uniref:Transcriptional regulator LacI/GalR-like sensor domain-containing protein n=1 Tax=Reticulibacter mediterranei TaxID=2778369 RepID=A0A8J3I941_9CHLR|nr:substrate-binding domain-containing protein [Reticulibacter mediterranei]GHO91139.1 hypothetical protein KSF_011870 [Reticulibacter mediterranei]